MVEIIVLGTAQDGGIPHFMCDCQNCTYYRESSSKRLVSSIGVIGKTKAIIIDATPDLPEQYNIFKSRLSKYNLNLDAIFLTHLHIGHYTGLMYFGRESISSKNFPVYSTKENFEFLNSNKPYSYLFERNEIQNLPLDPNNEIFIDDELIILPFLVPHRNEDGNTVGFEIINESTTKKTIYIPDIDFLTPEVDEKILESDLVLLDATFYKQTELMRQRNIPHPPILETISRYGLQKPNKFYFIHLNHSNPVLDTKSQEYQNIRKYNYQIAVEQMTFSI